VTALAAAATVVRNNSANRFGQAEHNLLKLKKKLRARPRIAFLW
jgi:hypothetical protein